MDYQMGDYLASTMDYYHTYIYVKADSVYFYVVVMSYVYYLPIVYVRYHFPIQV